MTVQGEREALLFQSNNTDDAGIYQASEFEQDLIADYP